MTERGECAGTKFNFVVSISRDGIVVCVCVCVCVCVGGVGGWNWVGWETSISLESCHSVGFSLSICIPSSFTSCASSVHCFDFSSDVYSFFHFVGAAVLEVSQAVVYS